MAKDEYVVDIWESNRRQYLEWEDFIRNYAPDTTIEMYTRWIQREDQATGDELNKKWAYAMLDCKFKNQVGASCLQVVRNLEELNSHLLSQGHTQEGEAITRLIAKFADLSRAVAEIPLMETANGIDMFAAAIEAAREAADFRKQTANASAKASDLADDLLQINWVDFGTIMKQECRGFQALNQYNPQVCLTTFQHALKDWKQILGFHGI
ncbi:MAG TPA: hypothetical protein VKK79_20965 [Candidatus Lokiarchaeia archaeon]|nr:hypothetical protein [Candidatus Lokiarchaeia archaeon]